MTKQKKHARMNAQNGRQKKYEKRKGKYRICLKKEKTGTKKKRKNKRDKETNETNRSCRKTAARAAKGV